MQSIQNTAYGQNQFIDSLSPENVVTPEYQRVLQTFLGRPHSGLGSDQWNEVANRMWGLAQQNNNLANNPQFASMLQSVGQRVGSGWGDTYAQRMADMQRTNAAAAEAARAAGGSGLLPEQQRAVDLSRTVSGIAQGQARATQGIVQALSARSRALEDWKREHPTPLFNENPYNTTPVPPRPVTAPAVVSTPAEPAPPPTSGSAPPRPATPPATGSTPASTGGSAASGPPARRTSPSTGSASGGTSTAPARRAPPSAGAAGGAASAPPPTPPPVVPPTTPLVYTPPPKGDHLSGGVPTFSAAGVAGGTVMPSAPMRNLATGPGVTPLGVTPDQIVAGTTPPPAATGPGFDMKGVAPGTGAPAK